MEIIGIKCCDPESHPSRQTWRVTWDGSILGDSRGYRREQAIEEARRTVARDPAHRILDPALR